MEYLDVLTEEGDFTNKVASREECHTKGYYHKAVVVFVLSEDNQKILLQQRSANKKMWPNLWDITAGGHVLTGELGWQAALREAKEEIGITFNKGDLEFIGSTISEKIKGDMIDHHFNEYYIIHKDVDIKDIVLQKEEVQDVRWFTKEEIISKVNDNFNSLTTKESCWHYLIKYLELVNK